MSEQKGSIPPKTPPSVEKTNPLVDAVRNAQQVQQEELERQRQELELQAQQRENDRQLAKIHQKQVWDNGMAWGRWVGVCALAGLATGATLAVYKGFSK